MLNVLYNNHYQIVQSPGYVVIVVEMNHDARIIRLGGTHPPRSRAALDGRFDRALGRRHAGGRDHQPPSRRRASPAGSRHRLYLAPNAKVTERFTRVAADEILYEFTVEDPTAYTQPWRGEMPLRAAEGPIYEYACHEGNRSLPGILRGARYEEKQR